MKLVLCASVLGIYSQMYLLHSGHSSGSTKALHQEQMIHIPFAYTMWQMSLEQDLPEAKYTH